MRCIDLPAVLKRIFKQYTISFSSNMMSCADTARNGMKRVVQTQQANHSSVLPVKSGENKIE